MMHKLGYFLLTFCIFNSLCETEIPVIVNNTQEVDPALYQPTVSAVQTPGIRTLKNCSLVPKFPDVRHLISTLASENKLVKIKVVIIGENGPLNDTYPGSVYKPHQWVISTSLTGNSMLMLKEYFDAMSLMTLGHGVASAPLTLIQKPDHCLKDAHVEEIENSLRLHFLTNFDANENDLPENAIICNAHVQRVKETDGKIVYVCCSRTLNNMLQCSVLKESTWFKLLFVLISVLQVLIVLYSPYFVPASVSTAKNVFQKFLFETETGKVLKLNVKKIAETDSISSGFVKTIQHSFSHLSNFKMHLKNMVPGKAYTIYVKGVDMAVRSSKIIAEGKAPVSVMSFIRNFFVRCNLRYDVSSVAGCCNQNMCVLLPCKFVFPWYRCLGFVMMIVMGTVITSPWILRVWFYYAYEEEAIQHQMHVLQSRNLTFPYTGNMLSYLSPSHTLYLVMYLFILIEFALYMIMPDSVKRKLKWTVRTCIRDMHNTPKLEACAFFAAHMLWPLEKFGVFGCVVLPLWLLVLPLCLLLLSLEVLPIANLSVRLLVNALYYSVRTVKPDMFNMCAKPAEGKLKNWVRKRLDSILVVNYKETNKRRNQIIQAVSLILSFATMWVFLFIVIDCIAFYVECAIYALVGFILNPRDTMKYVSLILLIAVYGNECFSGVHSKYAAYSKAINTEVQSMIGEKIAEEASKSESEQENVAFRIPNSDIVAERMNLEAGSEGYLKWRARRLVLFLDKSDIPYIPKIFLFEMGTLNHHFCPGVIHLLYLKALLDFSLILGFLMFVFIVIFAFGQAQDISSGGQTIAALGSGFLPLVLRKFLFQTHAGTGVDKSNLKWKYMFVNAVQTFSTRWNFTDIHVTHMEETDLKLAADASNADNTGKQFDIATVTEGISGNETTVKLIEKTHAITDENIRGSLDLIVKSTMDNEGKEIMTFYVPGNSVDDAITDVTITVNETAPVDESII
ncbi:uncharacterized protein LOC123533724 [Mercenaria mercenaria]|uniref:uncharacterized protein LOC123533724 n=1 Tax=Mercenaria mercenaria TaxID=6596 RepID=UPI00234E4E3A|nr:uncharacterized protein LOC123533724 [Mercenaria mercenaria]